MKKTYYFLAGLPRSGSTVLASILNQNPEVYVTPTSPLLDLLIENQNSFHKLPSVIANPNGEQLTNITRAMIDSAWIHRSEPIIIDKNRGWNKNYEAATILFGKKIKTVNTVRDLPSIMASWLTLIKKDPNNTTDFEVKRKGFACTDENRMAEMWFFMVKDCMEGLRHSRKSNANALEVNYDDLIASPRETLKKIETFLELPHWQYDFDNIVNEHNDDDLVAWGMNGMHTIRPKLEKTSKDAKEILGESLYNRFVNLERQYQ